MDELQRRARRAYERGRLRWALTGAWPAALIGGLAWFAGASTVASVAWAAASIAALGLARWRRTNWGEGVALGIAFSLVPLSAAIWMHFGHSFGPAVCNAVCTSLGVVGGAVWGLWAARKARGLGWDGVAFTVGSAGMVAAFGCSVLSVGSVTGILVGLAGGALAVAGRPLLAR